MTTEESLPTAPQVLPHKALTAAIKEEELPANRFELELEFVQALASPAYLHFLATTKSEAGDGLLLQEPEFMAFLRYLQATWRQAAYSRFLNFPHSLYFLELLIDKPAVVKEWTLPQFRNFCHQQQFLAWQHRHEELYGSGTHVPPAAAPEDATGAPFGGGAGNVTEGAPS
jgi:mediator of RNA polymerase II transcription subunit 31